MEKKKILVVDDELDLVEFVRMRLEANNYEVISATDGQEAMDIIAKTKPDLILLDIVMPKISGINVCQTLKKAPGTQEIPIIMLTAKDKQEEIALAQECGAQGYIIKPFEAHTLLYHIETLLKQKPKK